MKAALLVDLGGPSTAAEVEPYLGRLLSDPAMVPFPALLRPLLPPLLARLRAPRVRARYEEIGFSPVNPETTRLAAALEEALAPGALVLPAFRYSSPSIGEQVETMASRGAESVIVLPTFLHESGPSYGTCVEAARAAAPQTMTILHQPPDPTSPPVLDALEAGLAPLLSPGAHVLMVAHGLPMSLVRKGDRYPERVEATAQALGARLPDHGWSLAWQSRIGPVEWTRPYLDDELARLAREGVRDLVVAPISFATENLETLWDLDREASQRAVSLGFTSFKRAPAPGAHPRLLSSFVERFEVHHGRA